MAKILIVEDDDFLREVLSDYLGSRGHSVNSAPNGKVAKNLATMGHFDLIISDVQMPFLNGVELLQWLRTQSQTPFILMTGFTNLLETQRAADLGAQGFLSKPFSNEDLLNLIKSILAPPELPPSTDATAEPAYCKVSIDEFVARPKIDYDIYVRLSGMKFLKVAHAGDLLDVERLRTYREKGITHLHIKKEDFAKLVDFNIQVSKVLKGSRQVSPEKKARFMRYTAEIVMEKCYIDEMNREAFDEAQNFVTASLGVMTDNPDVLDMLEILNGHSDALYAHCLGVAIYSVLIAKAMSYQSPQTCFKLSMSGLFHDIGKKEIDRAILEKPRHLLSATERKLIESHCQRGREIMEFIPGVSSDVVQIIYEHHEDEIEQGYPCGTPKNRLHPLSRIVHLADQFVTRAVKSATNSPLTASEALAQIEKFDGDRVNKAAVEGLRKVLNHPKAA